MHASCTWHPVTLGKEERKPISHTSTIPKLYPPRRAPLWGVWFSHLPPPTSAFQGHWDFREYPFLHLIAPASLCLNTWKLGTVLSISNHIQWPVIDSFFLAISKMYSSNLPKTMSFCASRNWAMLFTTFNYGLHNFDICIALKKMSAIIFFSFYFSWCLCFGVNCD